MGIGFILLATVFFLQLWRAGLQASREELGNRQPPPRDGVHLVLTGLAIVLGLVLLIIWISHPILLPFGGNDTVIVPAIAFVIFVYAIFVVGISSSQSTSGERSNPWLRSLSLFAAGSLLLAVMWLPMLLLPYTRVPPRYHWRLEVLVALVLVYIWQFLINRVHRRHSGSTNP